MPVAVEISKNQILLAAAQTAGSRFRLNVVSGIAIDAQDDAAAITAKLKELVDANGLAKSDAVAIIARSDGELRELSLPPSPDNELPNIVRFKAKSDFASFNDRWLLDFTPLDDNPSETRRVLASAISPEVADRNREIIEGAGLKLKRMVLRPLATIESLDKVLGDAPHLVIAPGDDNTDLIVAHGGKAVTTRTIRRQRSQTAEAQNRQLISEVRRTLASLKRQPGVGKVEHVLVLDEAKSNRHLSGDLTERLGLSVQLVDPLEDVVARKNVSDDFAKSRRWQYASLIGSLVGLADEKDPSIDFLNPTRPQEIKSDKSRYWLYGTLAALATLLIVGLGWWTLRSQAEDKKLQLERLITAQQANQAKGAKPSIETILGRTGAIDRWKRNDIDWLEELNQFSQHFLTADDAIVSNFDARLRRGTPEIIVKFKAASTEAEASLTRELEKRPYLVDPSQSRASSDKDYPFQFDATVGFIDEGPKWRLKLDKKAREFDFTPISPAEAE